MSKEGIAVACVFLILGTLVFIVGFCSGRSSMRVEAVEHLHAEYYFDANHNRKWRWLNDREGSDAE